LDQAQNFPLFCMPASLQFGVDQLIVDRHFEATALGRYQGNGLDVELVLLGQICHQTDGSVRVVSNRAVDDSNFHSNISLIWEDPTWILLFVIFRQHATYEIMQEVVAGLRRCTMRKFASFVFGSVMGAMFGAVVALLIAPSSGEELQARARVRVATLRDEVQNAYDIRTAQLQAELEALSSSSEGDEQPPESE